MTSPLATGRTGVGRMLLLSASAASVLLLALAGPSWSQVPKGGAGGGTPGKTGKSETPGKDDSPDDDDTPDERHKQGMVSTKEKPKAEVLTCPHRPPRLAATLDITKDACTN